MYENRLSELIENNEFESAAALLTECIEKDGFNDTYAIFAAHINFAIGDMKSYLDMVESGLSYDSSNYELHLMKGDYYRDSDVLTALNEYELSLRYAYYDKDCPKVDYNYISDVFDSYKSERYELIKSETEKLPILIYKSESICFGILNRFADILGEELKKAGEIVEYIDVTKIPPQDIYKRVKTRYKAIIGIQTYVFSILFQDGRNMHDFILGPKYNMVFDHPACMYNHFTKAPIDFFVLTHDRNYYDFIKEYYPNIKETYILPPGGVEVKREEEKKYELVFIGSYKSPKTWDKVIEKLDDEYGGKASMLIDYMMQNPNIPYEKCLKSVFGECVDAKVFFDMKETYFKVMSYYREKVLLQILNEGICLDVFDDSFKDMIFSGYDNLKLHKGLSFDESLNIYSKARASLNIMSWHKDGRTERVANSMLNYSVVISDKCEYLCENYNDMEEILLFDLKDIESGIKKIKAVLSDREKCKKMSEGAYKKSLEVDTWRIKAKDFLKINFSHKI